MSKPLWPAVSGAMARDAQIDVISNNLANVNTNGFKRDDVTFKEYLSKNENPNLEGEDIPRSPIRDKDLYPLDGRDQSFVVVNGTHTKFATGGFKVTDNPLDIALEGPGFFEISTPNGVRYTRAGSFKIAPDGKHQLLRCWIVSDLANKVGSNSLEKQFKWGQGHVMSVGELSKIVPNKKFENSVGEVISIPKFNLVMVSNTPNFGEEIERIEPLSLALMK